MTTDSKADLTARVYPGYIFSTGERPDISKLNRLGTPTIVIVGTLDGTNVGLSAGSVTLTMLSGDIYDNVTIDTTNGTSLRVKPSGIRPLQLWTNMFDADSALYPSATFVRVNVDGSLVLITNNTVSIHTTNVAGAVQTLVSNLIPGQIAMTEATVIYGNGAGKGEARTIANVLAATTYSNSAAMPAAGAAASFTHTMGNNPSYVRATAWCISTDQGYAVGDEVDLPGIYANSGQVGFSIRITAGQLKIIRNNGTLKFLKASDGSEVNLDDSKWVIVARVRQ